jgi:hypothetical protein
MYQDIIKNQALDNRFTKIYLDLIDSRKKIIRKKLVFSDEAYELFEFHHILPKSMWREYSKETWNRVLLIPKEHYLAHKLLTKMFAEGTFLYKKSIDAFFGRFYFGKAYKYDIFRTQHAELVSKRMKGRRHSEETKNKLRGRHVSEETKQKLRGPRPESGKKISLARKGKVSARTPSGEVIVVSKEEFHRRQDLVGVNKGRAPWLFGRSVSQEQREKTRQKNKGKANPKAKEFRKGKVSARTLEGKIIVVMKEEFQQRSDLVGMMKGRKHSKHVQ